jgi:RimJ/RimL family protein N-acetyltransferase
VTVDSRSGDDPLRLQLSDGVIALWPVTPADHEFLFHCSVSEGNGLRWLYHGQVPSVEMFAAQLHNDVHAHFIVRDAGGNPLGYVVAYAANLRCRHVHVGALFAEYAQQHSFGTRALALFIGYLFDVWDLMGIYAEIPEYTFVAVDAGSSGEIGGRLPFEVVGRRPRFHYQQGRYWDDIIVYLPVEAWRSSGDGDDA